MLSSCALGFISPCRPLTAVTSRHEPIGSHCLFLQVKRSTFQLLTDVNIGKETMRICVSGNI